VPPTTWRRTTTSCAAGYRRWPTSCVVDGSTDRHGRQSAMAISLSPCRTRQLSSKHRQASALSDRA
jgi:hypothetical protein